MAPPHLQAGDPVGAAPPVGAASAAMAPAMTPITAEPSPAALRLTGIEGLRGWLAWTVVAGHIVSYTVGSGAAPWLWQLSHEAVLVFIIISGFVITHLLLTRPEPYRVYLTRRFFRLYPVYLFALGLGIAGTFVGFATFLDTAGPTWGQDVARLARHREELLGGHFMTHLLAHLTMLHGTIPGDRLFDAQYMFLGPAWSLSLEWQFYLVAPAVVALARRPGTAVLLVIVAFVGMKAWAKGFLGPVMLPGMLPAAGLWFGVGIATRLALPRAGTLPSYPTAALLLAVALLWGHGLAPVLCWAAFIALLMLSPTPRRRTDRIALALRHRLLEGPWAQRLGAASYSTYILHVPVIQLLTWGAVKVLHLGPWQTLGAVGATAVPLVLGLSLAARRWIERPGMRWGARIAEHLSGSPPPGLAAQRTIPPCPNP